MAARPIREADWTSARAIRREQESQTKDALIRAALQVFSQRGYAGATIGDVTAAAEVSRPTFYVYFASKAEVFRVVAESLRDEVLEAHEFTGRIAADPVLLSRASTAAFITLYAKNLEILDEISKRALTDPAVARLYDEMVRRPFWRILRFGRRLVDDGVAQPLVNEEYTARLMRAVLIDSAASFRDNPEHYGFIVDQATRVFLALAGFTGDMSQLSLEPADADPAFVPLAPLGDA